MQFSYKFSDAEKRIYINLSGNINLDELLTVFWEIVNDPEFDKNLDFLTDASSADFKVSTDDVEEFAKVFRSNLANGSGKSALIVNTPMATALSMLHQEKVRAARTVKIFYTKEAAENWLNETRNGK